MSINNKLEFSQLYPAKSNVRQDKGKKMTHIYLTLQD